MEILAYTAAFLLLFLALVGAAGFGGRRFATPAAEEWEAGIEAERAEEGRGQAAEPDDDAPDEHDDPPREAANGRRVEVPHEGAGEEWAEKLHAIAETRDDEDTLAFAVPLERIPQAPTRRVPLAKTPAVVAATAPVPAWWELPADDDAPTPALPTRQQPQIDLDALSFTRAWPRGWLLALLDEHQAGTR